ncbi:MAG: VOC family protein [Anderseniella sp.]
MAGLDHVVHCTSNFDGLRATMAQIGFTLTPPAEHPFGTGNSLVQLDGFFLEFLHLPNPHLVPKVADGEFGFAAHNAAYMKDGREGVSMLVFESGDAAAEQARFAEEGLDTYKTFDFSRLAKQPDGEEITVGFSLAFATHADMPRAAFFYCQQHAPQYFWKSEYQRHANTAVGIGEVAMVAAQPQHYAAFLATLSQGETIVSADNMVRNRTQRGALAMYSPAAFETAYGFSAPSLDDGPVLAGYRIEVENREVALNQLDDAHVEWRETPSGHAVGPDVASGAVMAFSEVF